MKVARRYKFRASHSLPGVAGYDTEHWHDYTVEVVVEGEVDRPEGMVLDTGSLDDVAAVIFPALDGTNLNDSMTFPTTVENLAGRWWSVFASPQSSYGLPVTVTVWEDDDRWGQAP